MPSPATCSPDTWKCAHLAGLSCEDFSSSENLDSCLARIFRRRFIPGRSMRSEWSGVGAQEFTWGRVSKCAGPSIFYSAGLEHVTGTWDQPIWVPMAHGAGTQ